jgi:hypothetical protein
MRSLATLVLVVAACGDDGNVNPLADAPLAPDSPPADAPTTGLVTLTVTLNDQPQVGIRVYFQNADSSLVSATETDANGVASATMDAGGYVTAIDPFVNTVIPEGVATNLGDMKTFANVKPLDNLVLKGRRRNGGQTQTNVTILAPEDPGATEYVLLTNCGSYFMQPSGGSGAPAGGPITLVGCGATIDVVVETRDSSGVVRGSFSVNGVAISEGATVDFTMVQDLVYTNAVTTTWMYSNVPGNIENVTVDGFLATARGPIVSLLTEASVTAGSAVATLAHATADDSIQVNVSDMFGSGLQSFHTVVEWGAPTTTYMLVMNNGTLMPDVTGRPAFDKSARAVTWTTGGTNTRVPDLAITRARFNRISLSQTWTWEIAAAHGATTTVALPVLPAPDDGLNALADDEVSVETLLTAQVPGGYDTIRANALTFAEDPTRAAIVGATGTIVLQAVTEPSIEPSIDAKPLPRPRPPTFTRH